MSTVPRHEQRILPVNDPESLQAALDILAAGELLIVPTETVYGLTADATNQEAVTKLFAVKGRSIVKPAAIYLSERNQIEKFASVDRYYAQAIIDKFLPGPLTVVLKSKNLSWPGVVSAEQKVGIRVSSDLFMYKLVREFGKPLIATSANNAGAEEVTSVSHLSGPFADSVLLLLSSDKSCAGVSSTVVDLTGEAPVILREGAISESEILKTFKECRNQ